MASPEAIFRPPETLRPLRDQPLAVLVEVDRGEGRHMPVQGKRDLFLYVVSVVSTPQVAEKGEKLVRPMGKTSEAEDQVLSFRRLRRD